MKNRPRRHRLTVGDATFIVTSNVDGNKRWIREVHHVRKHRSGSSADVCIYPNGGRKPSATLSSLWAYLGIDPAARWMECAADHPAFPARRSIKTALDQADDARKSNAAAAVLVAAGWTWTEGEDERWIAPTAQGIDLGPVRELLRRRMAQWRSHLPCDPDAPGTVAISGDGEGGYNNDVRLYREGIAVMDEVLGLIDHRDPGPGVAS